MSDPTDPGGVSANAERARSTRVGDSGSPVGSPLTIVLALIAVVVGFLIFRSIDNSDAGGVEPPDGATTVPTTATTVAGAATTAAPATTVTAGRVTDGATVIVANASAAGGVATEMTSELESAGYTMAEPTDQAEGDENLDTSIVYYVTAPPQIKAVADSVARDLGGITVEAMPSPIPVDGGSIGTATVLVMLGNDIAGETIDDLGGAAAANVQAPAPAGGATTTT
jgi:LytR cell envelope-related transcriptional attenuator